MAISEGPDILLDKPILLVGRHPECDIQIASRKISRRHCCIAQVKDRLVVRDLFSTNGIRINGTRVNEGFLNPGDELTIGNFRYQVRWPEQDQDKAEEDQGPKTEAQLFESGDEPVPLQETQRPGQDPDKPI